MSTFQQATGIDLMALGAGMQLFSALAPVNPLIPGAVFCEAIGCALFTGSKWPLLGAGLIAGMFIVSANDRIGRLEKRANDTAASRARAGGGRRRV